MRWSILLTSLGICLATAGARAQQGGSNTEAARRAAYLKAAQSIDKDLEGALAELTRQREAIAKEKPGLSKEANTIAADLREKRRLADLARTSREAAESDFAKLENELKTWRSERQYIESLLFEFRKSNEAQQSLARNEANRELLDDPTPAGHLGLLEVTIQQLQGVGKVETLTGEAISGNGVFVPGTFAEAGPVSWFLSDDRTVSGLISVNSDLQPQVVAGTGQASRIEAAIRGRRADLQFDPTMGTAVALDETKRTLLEHIREGGFWMYPILLLGVVAFFTGIIKWVQLSKVRGFSPRRIQEVLDHLNRGEARQAIDVTAKIRHPARNILEHGIQAVTSGESFTKEELEEALYEKYIEAVPPLQRGLPLLSVAAGAGPLLGLLATVTGIMETFRLITIFGSGDAKPLASGISEALIGTEYGLMVAIPSLIAYALFSRKVTGIKDTMELTSLAFLNGLRPGSFSVEPAPLSGKSSKKKPATAAPDSGTILPGGSTEALA